MKCPHCGYEHGWSGESMTNIQGKEGEFFYLPITLEREGNYYGIERVQLVGCPECKKTFTDNG